MSKCVVRRVDGAWHVFNGLCQIAGPYATEEKALEVRDGIEQQVLLVDSAPKDFGPNPCKEIVQEDHIALCPDRQLHE